MYNIKIYDKNGTLIHQEVLTCYGGFVQDNATGVCKYLRQIKTTEDVVVIYYIVDNYFPKQLENDGCYYDHRGPYSVVITQNGQIIVDTIAPCLFLCGVTTTGMKSAIYLVQNLKQEAVLYALKTGLVNSIKEKMAHQDLLTLAFVDEDVEQQLANVMANIQKL